MATCNSTRAHSGPCSSYSIPGCKVTLVGQADAHPCTPGGTFGCFRNGSTWVTQGCRGRFVCEHIGGTRRLHAEHNCFHRSHGIRGKQLWVRASGPTQVCDCPPYRHSDPTSVYSYPAAKAVLGYASRAQDKEDLALYEQFFKSQTEGRFVEMGALDGLSFSNTFALETVLGWRGILLEANPRHCRALAVNRPRAKTLCTAVSANETKVVFTAGRFTAEFHAINVQAQRGHRREIEVPAAPLGVLLRRSGVVYLDLFSLDVEGSELDALQSMDWSIPVRVWCIEWNPKFSPPSLNRSIAQIMEHHGYRRERWQSDRENRLVHNQLWVWGHSVWRGARTEAN